MNMKKTISSTSDAVLAKPAVGVLLLHVPAAVGDPNAHEQFERMIVRALASGSRVIVVDLSEAQSVSTVLLGLLLNLRHGLAAVGGEVRLIGVQPMVRRVLNICRLDQLFSVLSSPAAATDLAETAAAV